MSQARERTYVEEPQARWPRSLRFKDHNEVRQMIPDEGLTDLTQGQLSELLSSSVPVAQFVVATPMVVDTLLVLNEMNRPVRKAYVDYFTSEIKKENWVVTHQGVAVDLRGVLIDGQHRLLAIREAGYPAGLGILLVCGLSTKARTVVDIGLKRSFADLMHFAFEHPEATSNMIAVTRAWGTYTGVGVRGRVSPVDVANWYVTILPALERVAKIAGALKRLPAPVLAAVVHRLHRVPEDDRPLMFVEQLLSLANLPADSPVLRLAKYLADTKNSYSQGGTQQQDRFLRTVSALTAYLEGRLISKLYIRTDGLSDLLDA